VQVVKCPHCSAELFISSSRAPVCGKCGGMISVRRKRTLKRTPKRPPNVDLRTREYLTEEEVERLIEAAKDNRYGHRRAVDHATAHIGVDRHPEILHLHFAKCGGGHGYRCEFEIVRNGRADNTAFQTDFPRCDRILPNVTSFANVRGICGRIRQLGTVVWEAG
jgi:hypothetical protein